MGKIISPPAMLSYPHLFTPQEDNNGQKKYSCALVFLEGADLSEMKRAAIETAVEKLGEQKAKDMIRKKQLRLPFRDGAEKDYPEGSVFINTRGTRQPGIVSLVPDPKTGKPLAITNPDEVYAGCIVRASLSPFYYDREGNKGISFGLNNLQKIADGERIDGRAAAEDEFSADPNAVADLADLADDTAQDDEPEEIEEKVAKKGRSAKRELAGVGAGAGAADDLAELLA